jgi:hypothetical protein
MLHAKPCLIGPCCRCSTCHGISDPLALLLSPARAMLPQTPTPHTHKISMNKPLRPAKPGIHRHSRSLPGHALRPAQACTISALLRHVPEACNAGDPHTISVPLGHAPQVCTGLHDLRSARTCPQGLQHLQSIHV